MSEYAHGNRLRFSVTRPGIPGVTTLEMNGTDSPDSMFRFLRIWDTRKIGLEFNGSRFEGDDIELGFDKIGIGRPGNPSTIVIYELNDQSQELKVVLNVNFEVILWHIRKTTFSEITGFCDESDCCLQYVPDPSQNSHEFAGTPEHIFQNLKSLGSSSMDFQSLSGTSYIEDNFEYPGKELPMWIDGKFEDRPKDADVREVSRLLVMIEKRKLLNGLDCSQKSDDSYRIMEEVD